MRNTHTPIKTIVFLAAFMVLGYTQASARGLTLYSAVDVDIISDHLGVLRKYDAGFGAEHEKRSYVEARDDERYRIRVRNRSGSRIGVVIAVDGRNIISGTRSDLDRRERMYILGPYQSGEYAGWRTGWNQVNRFYFTGMDDSYAAAWNDYSAMGVIALAVYEDRHQQVYTPRQKKQKQFPMDRSLRRNWRESPGTGFGESEWSPSKKVAFEPTRNPAFREFIKYEYRSTLCRKGIVDCRPYRGRGRGNRFWPDHWRDHGFAPFPPGLSFR